MVFVRARELIEVPPGYAVYAGHNGSVVVQEWLNLIDDMRKRVRLEGNDNNILWAGFRRVFNAARMSNPFFTIDKESCPVLLHGSEMWSARDHGDIFASQ